MHAALPGMVDGALDSAGRVRDVVVVSSLAGRESFPGSSVYSAVKHGVNAFSESLRQEVSARGVRVTVVEPGLVRTEATADALADGADGQFADEGEPLEATDVADLVTHAVSLPARVNLHEVLIRPRGNH